MSTRAGAEAAPWLSVPVNQNESVPPPTAPGAVYVHTWALAGSPPIAGTGSASDPSVPLVSNEKLTGSASMHARNTSNFSPVRTPNAGSDVEAHSSFRPDDLSF